MHLEKGTFCVVPIKMLKGMHPFQQTIFMWLCHHANLEGVCWPSLETLAEECGISRGGIIAHLKKLEKIGYIIKTGRIGEDGGYQSNQYTVVVLAGERDNGKLKGSTLDEPGVVHDVNSPSTPDELPLVHQMYSNYIHTELNPTELNQTICATNTFFDQFWAVYPIHKSKQAALKAFLKIKPDEALIKTMLSALESQKKEREIKEQNKQFVPEWKHPSTWLNGRCWEDAVDLTIKLEGMNDKRTRAQVASDLIWESGKSAIDQFYKRAS